MLLHVVLEQWKIKVMVQFYNRLACLEIVVLIPNHFEFSLAEAWACFDMLKFQHMFN